MAKCSKCKRELPLDKIHFRRKRSCARGFDYVCKECQGGKFQAPLRMVDKGLTIENLTELYINRRLPLRKIASVLGVSTRAVMVYLDKYGIKTRSVSQANKGRIVWNKGKKGVQVAWNKNTTGIMKPNKTSFKKGEFLGSKHPMWKGGITSINKMIRSRKNEYSTQWRDAIFARDNYTCQLCGKSNCYVEAHHIKPVFKIIKKYELKTLGEALRCSELWSLTNGITLCKKCHRKAHSKELRKQLTV